MKFGNLLHIKDADSYLILPVISSRQDCTKVWLPAKINWSFGHFFYFQAYFDYLKFVIFYIAQIPLQCDLAQNKRDFMSDNQGEKYQKSWQNWLFTFRPLSFPKVFVVFLCCFEVKARKT